MRKTTFLVDFYHLLLLSPLYLKTTPSCIMLIRCHITLACAVFRIKPLYLLKNEMLLWCRFYKIITIHGICFTTNVTATFVSIFEKSSLPSYLTILCAIFCFVLRKVCKTHEKSTISLYIWCKHLTSSRQTFHI